MNEKYIQALRDAIRNTHKCASRFVETVPVKEELNGQTVWEGKVELFDLAGNPNAAQCFAWGYKDDAGRWQYMAVLKNGPVDSARKAIQAFLASQKKS